MKGPKLWKLAKKIIASGNMLLSKNPDVFLPNYGHRTLKKKKAALFGIWMVKNILICRQ